MSDKEQFERYVLGRFLELYDDFPSGEIVKSESPDFIIKTPVQTIGVEICKIVNEGEPGARYSPSERNAIEQKIAEQAGMIFLADVSIPLHVYLAFRDDINVRGARKQVLAREISLIVAREIEKLPTTEYYSITVDRALPDELMYIGIGYFPGITDSVWYAAKGQFVPNLRSEHLLRVISKKEDKIPIYRLQVDRSILLLVEGLPPDSMFDGIELPGDGVLKTQFENVFLYRNLNNQVVVLK